MITVLGVLILVALACAIVNAVNGKVPLWVAVIFIALALAIASFGGNAILVK